MNSALQTDARYPGLESALVECLERIFRTKYGASLIPHYMVRYKFGFLVYFFFLSAILVAAFIDYFD